MLRLGLEGLRLRSSTDEESDSWAFRTEGYFEGMRNYVTMTITDSTKMKEGQVTLKSLMSRQKAENDQKSETRAQDIATTPTHTPTPD